MAEFKGALLLSRLEQIAFSGGALRLLNGAEDPKLKRLLTLQFATAAADARRHLEDGARLQAARLSSLEEGVKRASTYVAEHGIDRKLLSTLAEGEARVYPPNRRHLQNVAENLAYLAEWLRKHQGAVRR
jgi:hypothetical protein